MLTQLQVGGQHWQRAAVVTAQTAVSNMCVPAVHPLQHSSGSDPWCKFNDHMLQLFTSCLFLAGGVAAIVGSWTCKRWVGTAGRLYWACGWLTGWGMQAYMQVFRKAVSPRRAPAQLGCLRLQPSAEQGG